LHAKEVFSKPRWEDFEYRFVDDRLTGWLGDGWSQAEKDKSITVNYLDDEEIDFPPILEENGYTEL
jgi:hypothetical protein